MDPLYHFTGAPQIEGCLTRGLRLGGITHSLHPPRVERGYQWLTENPSWDQSWDSMRDIPYPRTAYRITIEIPMRARRKLIRWDTGWPDLTNEKMARVLSSHGDPHHWFVFDGVVWPAWFRVVERNPEMPHLPRYDLDGQKQSAHA